MTPERLHRLALEAEEEGTLREVVTFWDHVDGEPDLGHGCFSQWWPSPIVIDGVTYPTAEHWMMASKANVFGDFEAKHRILATDDPAEAKRIGREVRGYDEDVWAKQRYQWVLLGNLAKFTQHTAPRIILACTADDLIVEASPYDRVWGVGLGPEDPDATVPSRWRGRNLLGFALMETRERLRWH